MQETSQHRRTRRHGSLIWLIGLVVGIAAGVAAAFNLSA